MMAPFSPQDCAALRRELESLADPAYKAFNESLLPGVETAYGIRLPQMRQVAKTLLRQDPVGFLEHFQPNCYEETQLRGLVIGGMKLPWEEKCPLVEDFLPRIDNWAVCDTFCGSLKPRSPQDVPLMWEFLKPLYASDEEYKARFAAVMQLSHFVDAAHLEEGLGLLGQVRHPGYYAKMAVAWALSVWFVKFPQETESLLAQRAFEPWVQNKAIQKVRESRRVSKEDKDRLLSYKL